MGRRPKLKEDNVAKIGGKQTAKKDFAIHHNQYHIKLKKGDSVAKVPKIFEENLMTENVI